MTLKIAGLSLLSLFPLALIAEEESLSQEGAIAEVRTAAKSFLSSLDEEELQNATMPFTGDERENWNYVPMERQGIQLNALDEKQTQQVHNLLGKSLSTQGHLTAKKIIKLEALLYERSNQSDFRDPGRYTVAIFGEPDPTRPWGWRFEGHHLSLNFTFVAEKAALTTPFFLGTNPAEVRNGPQEGLRPLGKIEDAARELATKLHDKGTHVRFSMEAPGEILTGSDRTAKTLSKEGVAATDIPEQSRKDLLSLVQAIATHQRREFLTISAEDLEKAQFAWAGEFAKGEPHYFRIQTPGFLIEYANTQNDGNHAHLVWRNFENDFGRDLLKEHLEEDH
jgi:hypothetical protein